ncbi:hypothetical protein Tco_0060715 [Tanacetum coccineum]
MSDYSLWEVILNGNKVLKRTVRETDHEYEPTTTEEKQDRRNEMKARGTLYGGNKESKKVQRTLLKQQYENFAGSSSEIMDQTFDRLQKLISQLEIQGKVITQDDMNLKLLRILPSEWKTRALIWRNKEEIETTSLDDLYNNLKIYEPEITGSSNTNNTAYGVSAAHTQSNPTSGDKLSDVVIYAFLASQLNSPQLAQEDLEQIDLDDLEEMDLQREMTVLTIRARRFIKRTRRKLDVNGQRVGFDKWNWSYQDEEEHPTNYALMAHTSLGSSSSSDSGLESVEARLAHYKKNEVVFKESINVLNLEVKLIDNVLVENKKKLEKEIDELKLTLEKFQNSSKSLNNLLESQVSVKFKTRLGYNAASSTAASPAVESFVNSSEMLENQENNKSKSDKGYHVVPPPFTGNFIPFKPNLTFMDEIVESENMDVITIVTPSNGKKVESNHESGDVKTNGDAVEPKTVRKNSFRPLVIEDWNSNDESKVEIIPKDKTVSSSIEKLKFVNSAREIVEKVETSKQNIHYIFINVGIGFKLSPAPYHQWTPKQNKHYPRGNQRNWKNLMSQRLGSDFKMINKACFVCGSFEHLHYVCDKKVIRPMWNNSSKVNHNNFANKMTYLNPNRRFVPQTVLTRSGKINTAGASVNTVVRPGNPQQKEYKEKGVIDNGCSRHMTGNKCYLTEYEDYDGGFVSFGDGKGRISGKVLSSDFKLLDESQVLLRVPRKDNIYSIDLKSVGIKREFSVAMGLLCRMVVAGEEDRNTDRCCKETWTGFLDVDYLTISHETMASICRKSNLVLAGTRDYIVTGQAEKKTEPEQEYILIPICTTDPLIS